MLNGVDCQIKTVRIIQILKDEGWLFLDNGYNRIENAINDRTRENYSFKTNEEFISWLLEKQNVYL